MKIRNKETGEIVEIIMPIKNGDGWNISANSLAELNEGWENYEEPNIYYFIDIHSQVKQMKYLGFEWQNKMIEIGNYFETREEAEKAVEKLKAWKRLRDRKFGFYGCKFNDILSGVLNIRAEFENSNDKQISKDLDLLFGGEE